MERSNAPKCGWADFSIDVALSKNPPTVRTDNQRLSADRQARCSRCFERIIELVAMRSSLHYHCALSEKGEDILRRVIKYCDNSRAIRTSARHIGGLEDVIAGRGHELS
jgi:hypothetical protein